MPTPLPPNTQFSHMPTIGDRPASGLRLSISALIAPQVTSVVIAAKAAPAVVPKRSTLPRDAQMLVERQRCDLRARDVDLAGRRGRAWNLIGLGGMGGEARIGLQSVVIDDPADEPDHHGQHDAVDDHGMPDAPEHTPVHQHQREREQHHREGGEEVRRRRRILERMGRIDSEEAAAVGAELLDGDGRDRAEDDVCGFVAPLSSLPIAPASTVVACRCPR